MHYHRAIQRRTGGSPEDFATLAVAPVSARLTFVSLCAFSH
jgi:hypothetical protein